MGDPQAGGREGRSPWSSGSGGLEISSRLHGTDTPRISLNQSVKMEGNRTPLEGGVARGLWSQPGARTLPHSITASQRRLQSKKGVEEVPGR